MKAGFSLSAAVFADNGDISEVELDGFVDDLIDMLETRGWHTLMAAHPIDDSGEPLGAPDTIVNSGGEP
jgi:hypothetical protein